MLRHRFLFLVVVLASVLIFATTSFAKGGLEVSLSPAKDSFAEKESVVVNVTISNNGRSAVRLLKWYTPIDGLEEPLFVVSLEGNKVEFVGPHYKRPEPTDNDYFVLKGGQSITRTVDLSLFYDLSLTGRYDVIYDASTLKLARDAKGEPRSVDGMVSNPVSIFVEGRAAFVPEPSYPDAVSGSTTYTRCTVSQQADAGTARNNASSYAANALSYLLAGTAGARYTTWFGSYDSGRYSTVRNHFSSISNAMDTASVNINCGCKKTYYAYVYPNQPYTIYVCKAFWTAPATGTDSKAGTLIHEMSHFTIVAGTDDWVYGQSGARNLAISDPAKAIDNADSHEYFAENTPFQN